MEVRESSSRPGGKAPLSFSLFGSVQAIEITEVTRQLAVLLGAGIPLVQALSSLAAQTGNAVLRRILAQIKEAVNEGSSLTGAMAVHPKIFSKVFINMVRAGEASGSLDVVLARLADIGEKQAMLTARVHTAMIYPAVMAVVGSAILLFLLTAVIPTITKVFADMKQVLPVPTLMLLAVSETLRTWWWLVGTVVLSGLFALRAFVTTQRGRVVYDLVKLKMPFAGRVVQRLMLARFASTLSSLLTSGVGLIASLQIVRHVVDNTQVAAVIDEATQQIQEGKSMAAALGASPWFPPMFVQMVAVGEQSGELGPMLRRVAEAYEREVETAALRLTATIEPLMIIVMGVCVGFVVLSILLPIFDMNQMIR